MLSPEADILGGIQRSFCRALSIPAENELYMLLNRSCAACKLSEISWASKVFVRASIIDPQLILASINLWPYVFIKPRLSRSPHLKIRFGSGASARISQTYSK
jgi:hypothetical protein